MKTATDSLRLVKLEISNYLKVVALTIDANGKSILISGANGQGKSSVCNAIFDCLRGVSSKERPEPVHRGADKALVRLDLGEYIVERHWTESGTRLVVTAADGSKVARPQQLLDGLLQKFALSPISFLQQRPSDQLDAVLHVCQVKPPVDQVTEITGEPFPPLPNESAARYIDRLAADQTGLLYVRRRDAGRVADQKKKARDEQAESLETLGGQLEPHEEPKSASELLTEIGGLQVEAEERRAALAAAGEIKSEFAGATERLAALAVERDREAAGIVQMERQLAELKKMIADRKIGINTLNVRIQAGNRVVAELAEESTASAQAAAAMPDPAVSIDLVRKRIATVEADNAKVAKRKLAADELERLRIEWEQANLDYKAHDGALEQVRQLRSQLLNGVDLGIAGLTVGMGELRLNDVPFSQASTAEQFRTSMALAMKERPKLRLLRLDGAEALDSESKALVMELASARGFQVIMASVADTDGLRVEIVDGLKHGERDE